MIFYPPRLESLRHQISWNSLIENRVKSSSVQLGFCSEGCSSYVVQQFRNLLTTFCSEKITSPSPRPSPHWGEGQTEPI